MTFSYEAREDRAKPSMWIVRILSLGATMLLLLNLADTSAVGQAPAPVQRVLVLYSDERLLPANIIIDEAIRTAFAASTNNRVEFYSEFLDVARFPGEEEQQRQPVFFRDKYRERPPDLVIAVSGGALAFLVYCSVAGDPHPGHLSDARIAEVPIPDSVAPTLEMMLRLHPDTRQVAVVSGNGPRDRQFADVYRQEMTTFGNRVAFTWLTDLSMEELRGRLSRLPDHTVVLYISMFQDAAGRPSSRARRWNTPRKMTAPMTAKVQRTRNTQQVDQVLEHLKEGRANDDPQNRALAAAQAAASQHCRRDGVEFVG